MQTLIVDHYDSFTYNLFQMVAQIQGLEPIVIAHDSPELATLNPCEYDNIILSPGPGHPENAQDFKHGATFIQHSNKPILGVCLGHQGIFSVLGGRVVPAPKPVHGCLSTIVHNQDSLFQHIPTSFQVMRYHSLICEDPAPEAFEIIARTLDGLIMGLRHRYKPMWGVQFHPESIACEYGEQLLINFQQLTEQFYTQNKRTRISKPSNTSLKTGSVDNLFPVTQQPAERSGLQCQKTLEREKQQRWKLEFTPLPFFPDPATVFNNLFLPKHCAVWLDSSQIIPGLSRFSYMGAINSPLSYQLIYHAHTRTTTKIQAQTKTQYTSSIFEYLQQALHSIDIEASQAIPFEFHGGFIGYFGYELHQETAPIMQAKIAPHPDAQWLFIDRFIVFDHQQRTCYLAAIAPESDMPIQQAWLQTTMEALQNLEELQPSQTKVKLAPGEWSQSLDGYVQKIHNCLDLLAAGETYEMCLTNKLHFSGSIDPWHFYLNLRHYHPAPHAAFLKLGDLYIACSSMERFLKIDAKRRIETKPIKGTMPRGRYAKEDEAFAQSLVTEEKFHSEHVMIVDLLRNDLGKICQIGTVAVQHFMQVETYATLHQLVSVIDGQLKPETSSIECIQRVFPGGSMTGAPKIRTMNLLNQLETEARGIYSGSLGYLSLNGAIDLNIIIRTAEITPEKVSMGAGGAIVALSDPKEELAEMILKTKALQKALGISESEPSLTRLSEHSEESPTN